MIEKIIALSSRDVRQGAKDSALLGLATGFLTAFGEVACGDMSLAATETVNTLIPTVSSITLGYLNDADSKEHAAGIASANIAHRIAYYGTKGIFALLQHYQF